MDRTMKHLFIFVISFNVMCRASHFRGGTISWKPTGNGREVEFTYKLGWRFNHGAGCTSSLVGSYVDGDTFPWVCTSGCGSGSVTLSSKGYTCIAASSSQGWELGEYSFKHTFSSDGKFTVSYSSCCWIYLDYGTGSTGISVPTTVDLRTRSDLKNPNTSPVAASKPLYTIKHGCTETIKIPVLDTDGDNVRCRWAVRNECSGACSRIPNTVLDGDKCTLTIRAIGNKGDMYAVAVMVEDMPRSTITVGDELFTTKDVLSSVPVQFLVNTPDIPSRSCTDKPVFVYPTPAEGEVIVVQPGKSLFLSVYATSKGSSIKEFQSFGPPGIQKSSIRQLTHSPQVYSVDLTWAPTPADKGSHSLCIEATDTYEISSDTRCVIISTWDVNPCDSDPCQNCGTCSRVGISDAFTCTCAAGFTGQLCETDINECISGPCQNKGTCTDIVNGYYCSCPAGFEGAVCQIDINECQGNPCQNGGTCSDQVNQYTCSCQPGFAGINCEIDIDECISRPCFNNGTCNDAVNGYSCSCIPGFTGTYCEINIDECQSAPCFNNGTCHDLINGYSCDCLPGYTGVFCEIDIDECKGGPCYNNGTCFDLINSFFCGCVHGYTGEQCEIDIDECEFDPCLNGGKCADLIGEFSCKCLPGFTGTICQTGLNPCDSNPCKNNGKCEAYNDTYFICDCIDGWGGENCAYRKQNGSFVNSSLMISSHMHYSDCNCFLGHAKQQHCYKYKAENSIGFGFLGTFLGILTAVGLYASYLICLSQSEPALETDNNKVIPLDEENRDDNDKSKDKHLHTDTLQLEESKEQNEPKRVKQHVHRHKHRKCWACEVKYNGVPPPIFWGK